MRQFSIYSYAFVGATRYNMASRICAVLLLPLRGSGASLCDARHDVHGREAVPPSCCLDRCCGPLYLAGDEGGSKTPQSWNDNAVKLVLNFLREHIVKVVHRYLVFREARTVMSL